MALRTVDWLMAAALAITVAAGSEGGEPAALAPGSRVMVVLAGESGETGGNAAPGARRLVGTVDALTADGLVLREEAGSRSLALGQIDSIRVSGGTRRGALQGFVVGALGGVAYAAYRTINCESEAGGACTSGEYLEHATVDTLLFAGALGGIGAAVGSLVKTERWLEVSLPGRLKVSASVGMTRRGAGARVVLAF